MAFAAFALAKPCQSHIRQDEFGKIELQKYTESSEAAASQFSFEIGEKLSRGEAD
ncbi:MAG: hypothetical protein P4K83_03035 [Terracidiphilus sp.]|nr:hypothetical protein [Terracidiphilus sp.]